MSTQHFTDDEIEKANQDTLDQVNSLIGKAEELAESDDWQQVMPLCQQAIDICTRRLGPLHICTLWHIKKMGAYLRQQRKYADAERVDRDLLFKWESKQPRDDLYELSVLDVLSNLVDDLRPQGLHDQVIEVQRQILQSVIRDRGEDAPYAVRCKNTLANSLHGRGDYTEALQLHEEALATLRRSGGGETPYAAVLLDMTAVDYLALGELGRAQSLQEEAVSCARKVCGSTHDTTVQCVANLSKTYRKIGKMPNDWIQQMESLIREAVPYGRDHNVVTADLLNALGNAYCDTHRYRDAQDTFSTCHTWAEKKLGRGHGLTRQSLDNFIFASTKTGDMVRVPIGSSGVTGLL